MLLHCNPASVCPYFASSRIRFIHSERASAIASIDFQFHIQQTYTYYTFENIFLSSYTCCHHHNDDRSTIKYSILLRKVAIVCILFDEGTIPRLAPENGTNEQATRTKIILDARSVQNVSISTHYGHRELDAVYICFHMRVHFFESNFISLLYIHYYCYCCLASPKKYSYHCMYIKYHSFTLHALCI